MYTRIKLCPPQLIVIINYEHVFSNTRLVNMLTFVTPILFVCCFFCLGFFFNNENACAAAISSEAHLGITALSSNVFVALLLCCYVLCVTCYV